MAVRLSALCTAAFYPSGRFLVLISVRDWVDRRTIVRLEGLGKLKKIHLIGTRTRNFPASSTVPQPTTLTGTPICKGNMWNYQILPMYKVFILANQRHLTMATYGWNMLWEGTGTIISCIVDGNILYEITDGSLFYYIHTIFFMLQFPVYISKEYFKAHDILYFKSTLPFGITKYCMQRKFRKELLEVKIWGGGLKTDVQAANIYYRKLCLH
jgi:hypothetical protein